MAEPARAAVCFAQSGHSGKTRPDAGMKNELGDALPLPYRVAFRAGVQQKNGNLPAVVGIDDTHALGHGEPFYRSKAAAGINKAGNAGDKGLNSDAGGNRSSLSRRDDKKFLLNETSTQIDAHSVFSGGLQSIRAIEISGVSKKKHVNNSLRWRNTCHGDAPVKE